MYPLCLSGFPVLLDHSETVNYIVTGNVKILRVLSRAIAVHLPGKINILLMGSAYPEDDVVVPAAEDAPTTPGLIN